MKQCRRCEGFVPDESTRCPNCRSTRRWWALPLSLLGASAASVTLSACYGAPCVSRLPDGGTTNSTSACYEPSCTTRMVDGGTYGDDPYYKDICNGPKRDGGTDGGSDGGTDAGP